MILSILLVLVALLLRMLIRDDLIREGPHPLTGDSSFSLVPHDEGLNKRSPAFEYEAWVMLLAFPFGY